LPYWHVDRAHPEMSWCCWCYFVADSCKFLHDRSDYKHGWQLEREAEERSPTRDEGFIYLFIRLFISSR